MPFHILLISYHIKLTVQIIILISKSGGMRNEEI